VHALVRNRKLLFTEGGTHLFIAVSRLHGHADRVVARILEQVRGLD
jgi:hypothetical protein